MFRSLLSVVAFALTLTASSWGQDVDSPPPTDERIREAWSYLLPEEQVEVTQWFTAEAEYLGTAQNRLIQYLLSCEERDRGTWLEKPDLVWYDPETHAPAQPIRRKLLDPDSAKATSVWEELKGSMPKDPMLRAWDYDWITGDIVQVGDERDPVLLFENAMMGLPPHVDYAEALLLRRLDDGSQRETFKAFLHIYTDRSGNAYPDVTLYDAWSSGRTFEMPDIDNLGILHDLFDDWKSFKAPVPGPRQKKLYDKIGEAFLDAKHHRQLLEAFTVNYLRGNAIPTNTYTPNAIAFNALWQEVDGDPEALAEDLPDPDDWEKYLKGLVKKVKKKKFRELGQGRIEWFEAERWQVKFKLIWVMEQFGAFDRDSLPKPPEPKQPKQG